MIGSMKTDIFGIIPQVGDIIVFNPPQYKGLAHGECIGFTKAGLPKLIDIKPEMYPMKFKIKEDGFYVPKTDFVIC